MFFLNNALESIQIFITIITYCEIPFFYYRFAILLKYTYNFMKLYQNMHKKLLLKEDK